MRDWLQDFSSHLNREIMSTVERTMNGRYLLYIDILGFSDLVEKSPSKVLDLYEVIASLHVHSHGSFRAIVFSDTILVYNLLAPKTAYDRRYLVMYLCEFAQDLQHRLIGRDVFFRAVLVKGEFNHLELNDVPCFYGKALIEAYRSEKKIGAIGLFIQNDLIDDNYAFATATFDSAFSFVFITQSLTRAEAEWGSILPIEAWMMEATDEQYLIVPQVIYVSRVAYFAEQHPIREVRDKYVRTVGFFQSRYPETMKFLEDNEFDVKALSPKANWAGILERYPESYSWAVKKKQVN